MDMRRHDTGHQMLNKVPEVTLIFWVIKILATTVGETSADFLIFNLHLGLAKTTAIMSMLLVTALVMQFRTRRCIQSIYWIAVVMVSIVGTLITDSLVDDYGIALAATFSLWYASEKTLSIHHVTTRKRETFYWLAILFTFALGTAAGDLAAETMMLGYVNSALMFGGMIALITFAYYVLKLNAITAFWLAYILTRPLGASFGDLLSQPMVNGGLGWGAVGTSVAFLGAILGLVAYLSLAQKRLS